MTTRELIHYGFGWFGKITTIIYTILASLYIFIPNITENELSFIGYTGGQIIAFSFIILVIIYTYKIIKNKWFTKL